MPQPQPQPHQRERRDREPHERLSPARLERPAPHAGLSRKREPVLDPVRAQAGRFNAVRVRLFVPSQAWGGRRRREILLAAALGAVLFHLAMVGAMIEIPGLLPHFLQPAPARPPPPPPEADLVMVKQNSPTVGGTPPPVRSPPSPAKQPQQAHAGGGMAEALNAPDGPAVPPPSRNPSPDPGKAEDGRRDASATPPPAPPASSVQVNLDLDGQPGWGLVDERTIAASPDDHYINKPAAYPRAAGMRGEEGTVYLATLIAPDGHAERVIVEQSSGYRDLDAAARNAVAAWHFRPAIRGGIAVESEMRMAYHFTIRD